MALEAARVLIVEDDATLATMIALTLTLDGHEVDIAGDGRAALEKLAAGPYDAIVSDLRMPRLDGLGLFRELERRHPDLCRRVVFITGDHVTADIARDLGNTGAPWLCKPFDIAELHATVERLLAA